MHELVSTTTTTYHKKMSMEERLNMKYDFFGQEWFGKCGACGTEMFAPTKSEYLINFSLHTHSENCLGGW
jgi:hypothetical protein